VHEPVVEPSMAMLRSPIRELHRRHDPILTLCFLSPRPAIFVSSRGTTHHALVQLGPVWWQPAPNSGTIEHLLRFLFFSHVFQIHSPEIFSHSLSDLSHEVLMVLACARMWLLDDVVGMLDATWPNGSLSW
jgi:hypothetical protein